MKSIANISPLIIAALIILGCTPEHNFNGRYVTTATPLGITRTSAYCWGSEMLIELGIGSMLDEFGVCWSTDINPTVDDAHLSTTDGTCWFNITGLMSNTEYHVRAYALCESEYYYGNDVSFVTKEINDDGSVIYDGHAYVDLGLPSGTLWATCNVGASTPEEYGDYFAWGETQPKDYYDDWDSYKYCMGNGNTLTRYCNDSSYGYNGFVDNLTTLLPEDDAATANWGSGWRTPTYEQCSELYGRTVKIWTMQDSINGLLLLALDNGNSVFLPAADYFSGSLVGSSGQYWSSSLRIDYPISATFFGFHTENYGCGSVGRTCGNSVRPVRSSR